MMDHDITYDEVESLLVWQALAKMATANASQLKQAIQAKLLSNPDGLDRVNTLKLIGMLTSSRRLRISMASVMLTKLSFSNHLHHLNRMAYI